jgi:hypothetical protein
MLSDDRPQFAQHYLWALDDVRPGVAAKFVATGVRVAFPLPILLPGVARRVVAIAVQLDRELVLGPTTVDKATTGQAIRNGQGKRASRKSFRKRRSSPLNVFLGRRG